jgi:hypothetical protein
MGVTYSHSSKRPFLIQALHIFALSSLAIAQPIYDLLGQNAEFFVAHRLGRGGILVLVAALSLGLPALLVAMELAIRSISFRLQQLAHVGLVWVLTGLILAPVMNKVPGLPSPVLIGTNLILSGALTVAYVKLTGVRSFVSLLGLGGVVFPALFLLLSPISAMVFPASSPTAAAQEGGKTAFVSNPVPIVFVVFDEFEAGALLDQDRNIDPVRFPNFASLARDAWWFRRATTVWTETTRAVPAILTGMRPSGTKAPTHESHPNNLFSWLKDHYRLNVAEHLTSLCPPKACDAASRTGFQPLVLLSDLVVIYGHVVLPAETSAAVLPGMDGGWAGFAAAHSQVDENDDGKTFLSKVMKITRGDRSSQFTAFVESIEGGSTLNFLHMLLPNNPHVYLPSGSTYPGKGTEGLVEKTWVEDPYFSALAYQRYMLQLAHVDALLGTLLQRLKEQGLYDSAMIIIAADHGRSFTPHYKVRSLAPADVQHASELLQVPLFIKLPGQKSGQTSDRFVHTIDIVPTIADALQADLPWKTDGAPATALSFPEREALEILPLDEAGEKQVYSLPDLTSYPRLSWKLATFGAHTPLGGTAIKSPHVEYLGKTVAEIAQAARDSRLAAEIEQIDFFADVDLSSGTLPALLRGEVKGVSGDQPRHLAIALNGTVAAVTRTAPWSGKPGYFAVMLPEHAFRSGQNRLEMFAIDSIDGARKLSRIRTPSQDRIRIKVTEGGEVLASDSGTGTPIRRDAVVGHLDTVSRRRGTVILTGWAFDPHRMQPAAKVVVFADDRQVFQGAPSVSRPDLVNVFKTDASDAGFALAIPQQLLKTGARLRVFGVSEAGAASELAVAEGLKLVVDPQKP